MWFLITASLSLNRCDSLSRERVIAEKLTGFQLTKEFLYCMEPELSLPYIILKIGIEILKSLKSDCSVMMVCEHLKRDIQLESRARGGC
jgi:hypothetical protein